MKFFKSFIFLCLLVLNCGGEDEKAKDTNAEKPETQTEQTISAQAIERFNYTEYVLSEESEKAVQSWEKYQELAIQINYLKKADLSFFNDEGKSLSEFILALKKSVPENLNTNPINSRIIVLETKILKLNDNLVLDNISVEVKLQSIKEVLVAFSNLNLQINKKLEFDEYNKIQPE